MFSFQMKDQSVIAPPKGVQKINAKITELVMADVRAKTNRLNILDLHGYSFVDAEGFFVLKAMDAIASKKNHIFDYMDSFDDVVDLMEFTGMKNSSVIFKN